MFPAGGTLRLAGIASGDEAKKVDQTALSG
jgi:hypothetical protein